MSISIGTPADLFVTDYVRDPRTFRRIERQLLEALERQRSNAVAGAE